MTEKWCEIQGKLDLVRVSGKFGLSARGSTVPESLAQGLMTKTTTLHVHHGHRCTTPT